jgi:hypothetical protein
MSFTPKLWKEVHHPNDRRNVRSVIEGYLRIDVISEDIQACFLERNAGKYGHKVIRVLRAVDVLLEADRDDGSLRAFGLSQWQLAQALQTVLRQKFIFDKAGNIIDYAPRVKALMAA